MKFNMDKLRHSFLIITWMYFASIPIVYGKANSTRVCGVGYFDIESGTISSPNFPGNYPSNTKCIWLIDATPGYGIGIRFTNFSLQNSASCSNDYVAVGGGKVEVRRLCGSSLPNREVSFRNRALRIEFVSDSAIELSGFAMQFRRISLGSANSNACGNSQLTDNAGSLFFPLSISPAYPDMIHCSWTIQVPQGLIRIHFNFFNVEFSQRCLNDYLVIYEDGMQQEVYCGFAIPPDYTSSSQSVSLLFFSDASQTAGGFALNWQVLPGFCETLPSTQHGIVNCVNDTLIGSVCQHICEEGFQLIGNDTSVCMHDQNGRPYWTNDNRRCIVSCRSTEVEGGTSSCSDGQSIDSICQYRCSDGFFLVGNSTSTCVSQSSFLAAWVPILPSCVGPPVPSAIMEFDVVPQDNKVTFTCAFAGFPLPDIEWKFENGTDLPETSQYQVFEQENSSDYETTRDLTVYGMACLNTSLLRFRCFATNIHTSVPVRSGEYGADIDPLSYLQIIHTSFTCEEAQSYCRNRGGNLAVIPTTASMILVNAQATSNYWVSSLSLTYVSWTAELDSTVSNPQGCTRVAQDVGAWSRDQTTPASVICEFRPDPGQPQVTAQPDACRGDVLNISWTTVPGAAELTHYVFINNQRLIAPPGLRTMHLDSLDGNTAYSIEVVPLFDGCAHDTSFSSIYTANVTTGGSTLMPVRSIRLTRNFQDNSCTVRWSDDLIQNRLQDLSHYEIRLTRKTTNQRQESSSTSTSPQSIPLLHNETEYTIIELAPNTEFDVEIGAVAAAPCAEVLPIVWSTPFQGVCLTHPTAPPSISLSEQVPYLKEDRFAVTLPPLDESRGPISCYILVIQKNTSKSVSFDSTTFESLKQAGDTLNSEEPFIAFVTSRVSSTSEVLLGDDSLTCCDINSFGSQSDCSLYSTNRNRRAISPLIMAQNRQLEKGANFNYYVFATVPSGNSTLFATSDVSVTFQQPSSVNNQTGPAPTDFVSTLLQNWYILVAIGVALLLILFLILALVLRRRKSRSNKHSFTNVPRTSGGVDIEDRSIAAQVPTTTANEPAYCEPIVHFTAKEFEDYSIPRADLTSTYLTKSSDNNYLFKKEFKKILTGVAALSTKYARQPECKDKNRNENFLPSDQARVQLESIGSSWGSDYINASFVDGFVSHRAFIAAQGPMQNTVEDFWKMVLENHCTKIVMLTRLRENKRVKCDCYWADDGKKEDFGNITVTTKSVKNVGHYKQREFLVKPKNHPSSFLVTQYQFMTWPDHDVPTTTSSLIRFREAVLSGPSDGTTLVHGSAGGGRTGTFLALLILCEQLDRCNEVNAVEALKKLRDVRTGMVENLKQYIYIHKLLCEISTLPVTDCLASEFPQYFNRMKDVNSYHTTNMMTEFDQLDVLASLHEEPLLAKCKPDKSSIKPYKRTCVNGEHILLQKGRKAITSLNLSEIQTYSPDVYLLTSQPPSKSKWQAFWNCIIDFNITCIIRIEEKERCDQNFFTGERDSFDDLSVSITKYEQHFGYIEKSIKIYKGGSSTPHSVQQIELNSWPINGFPPNFHTVVSVASRVKNHRTTNKQPSDKKYLALILCSDGSTRCGAFCAIFNLLERLDRENRVDVFREVKDLRDCRTKMVGNIQQYEFVYQAAAEYIEEFNPYQEMN